MVLEKFIYFYYYKWAGPDQIGLGRLTAQHTSLFFFLILGWAETGSAKLTWSLASPSDHVNYNCLCM